MLQKLIGFVSAGAIGTLICDGAIHPVALLKRAVAVREITLHTDPARSSLLCRLGI